MSDDNVLGFRATETVRRMRLAIYYERKFAEAIAAAIHRGHDGRVKR